MKKINLFLLFLMAGCMFMGAEKVATLKELMDPK